MYMRPGDLCRDNKMVGSNQWVYFGIHVDIPVVGIGHGEIVQSSRYGMFRIQNLNIKRHIGKVGRKLLRIRFVVLREPLPANEVVIFIPLRLGR